MLPEENKWLVDNIQEFFTLLSEKILVDSPKPSNKNGEELWFRGLRDMSWNLSPTLFRNIRDRSEYKNLPTETEKQKWFWKQLRPSEDLTLDEFKVRNYHLIEQPPELKFLWLSIMQHHGLATRLLDWSKQALTALFFAVEDYFNSRGEKPSTIPCVWVLKPHVLQEVSIHKLPNKKVKIAFQKKQNIFSLLCENCDLFDSLVLPVLAPHDFRRIQAQQGEFTIFPVMNQKFPKDFLSNPCLENWCDSSKYLVQVILTKPELISKQLKLIGLRKSMFYPEIPNVSIEIEQDYLRGK